MRIDVAVMPRGLARAGVRVRTRISVRVRARAAAEVQAGAERSTQSVQGT